MKNVWLIGSGLMGEAYAKVLNALNVCFTVIGNRPESCKRFKQKTGISAIGGGIEKFLAGNPIPCTHAIVAVCEDKLLEVTILLQKYGVKTFLLEKPGGVNYQEIESLFEFSQHYPASIFVAYNRRFYSSTRRAIEIIKADGGVQSFLMQFTEWSPVIEKLKKRSTIKESWFWSNSTHVLDLGFYLGGSPVEISSYIAGGISWHPHCSIFTGAGRTCTGALFSYHADWRGPGRWGVEIITARHRLIFCPLEKLQIQKLGSLEIEAIELDDTLDKTFKPGIYLQTRQFIEGKTDTIFLPLKEHYQLAKYYQSIYKK